MSSWWTKTREAVPHFAAALVLLAAGAAGGWWYAGRGAAPGGGAVAVEPGTSEGKAERIPKFWTCAMHPEVHAGEPGKCPKCPMDLIPVYEDEGDEAGDGGKAALGPRQIALSPAAVALAEVQIAPVERRFVHAEVRMVGKVDYDETRLGNISAWVPGRIDRLFVDYTGVLVRKGDHLVSIYSPDLISAQEELIQAKRSATSMAQSQLEGVRQAASANVESVRERLRLWGLADEQVAAIEARLDAGEKPQTHLTVYAPAGGTVVKRHVVEGEYVKTGMPIYSIADLSRVWVRLEAYESDMMWVRYGQDVEFLTEAVPGRVFHGRIAFIDPVLDERTRTVRVRVNVENEDAALKPGMFVRAVVRATVAGSGRVIDPDLEGKWISPMHPEIVEEQPGDCPICGMDLVPASELGFDVTGAHEPPLVVPASAVLWTGKRSVVYVQVPELPRPTFEGREVVLGPRAGNWYLVEEGLEEGERVVVNGSFKIDSALQIQAKPSMMSPEGGVPAPGHDHGGHGADPSVGASPSALQQPGVPLPAGVAATYLALHAALADNDEVAAAGAAKALAETLAAAGEGADLDACRKAAASAARAGSLGALRRAFRKLTAAIGKSLALRGWEGDAELQAMNCPMDQGGDWFQAPGVIANPYYGAGTPMLRCAIPGRRLEAKGEGR